MKDVLRRLQAATNARTIRERLAVKEVEQAIREEVVKSERAAGITLPPPDEVRLTGAEGWHRLIKGETIATPAQGNDELLGILAECQATGDVESVLEKRGDGDVVRYRLTAAGLTKAQAFEKKHGMVVLPDDVEPLLWVEFLAAFIYTKPRLAIELATLADPRSTETEIGPGIEVLERLVKAGLVRFGRRNGTDPCIFVAARKDFESDDDAATADRLVSYFDRSGEFDAATGEIVSVERDKRGRPVTMDWWLAHSKKDLGTVASEARMSRGHVAALLQSLDRRGLVTLFETTPGTVGVHFKADLEEITKNEQKVIGAFARQFEHDDAGRINPEVFGSGGMTLTALSGGLPVAGPNTIWMRAIEKQFKALGTLTELISAAPDRPRLDPLQPFRWHNTPEGARLLDEWMMNSRQLKHAETYAWGDDQTKAVEAASRTIPHDAPLRFEQVPQGGIGWFWFERPLACPTHDNSNEVCAVLWSWAHTTRSEAGETPHLVMTAFTESSFRGQVSPLASTLWRWHVGESVHDLVVRVGAEYDELYAPGKPLQRHLDKYGSSPFGREKTIKAVVQLSLFFLAACVWLEQDIIGWSSGHVERHRAKAFEREHQLPKRPTEVKVIALRRVKYEKVGGESGDNRREYSCRWIVDGHFRNQFYRSKGQHKVIWIDPYPKGPADKPLRVHTHKVYAVVR